MIILFWILSVIFVVADIITKNIAETNIAEGQVIKALTFGDTDILWFSLHHNSGAAFSSFTGKAVILAVFTSVAMAAITVYFHKIKHKHILATVSYAMVLGGGVGNLIDRVARQSVTDFIHLFPFTFIFNFADICVVIGAILLVAYYIFIDEKYCKRFEVSDAAGDSSGE